MKKPEICRIAPCNPGETVQFFGENLKNCRAYVWMPPVDKTAHPFESGAYAVPAFPQCPEGAIEMQVTASYDQVLYALMPYIEHGCMLVWLKNEAGEAAGVVNRPEVWNQSLFTAIPGDRLALYGQNYFGFDHRYFPDTRLVLMNRETGKVYDGLWGSSQDLMQNMPGQNDHKSEYILPQDIPAGEYLYAMTNGTGGIWGYSEPGGLVIEEKRDYTAYARMKWSYDCKRRMSFDMSSVAVTRFPMELGDGLTDVTAELQGAIDATAERGGVVVLPAGRYGVTKTIHVKKGVVLKGAGMGATTLTVAEGAALENTGMPPVQYAKRANDAKCWAIDWKPYMDADNNTPLVWIETHAGLEDIKLEGASGTGVLVAVGTQDGAPSEGVFFNNVHIDNAVNASLFMNGDFTMAYHGIVTTGFTNDFTLYKCRVEAAYPLFMMPAQNFRIRLIGNVFEVSPRQSGDNVFIGGSYYGIMEENTFRYGRRSLMCQQGFSNNWVFQNRSEGVANTTNANEEYMSEYGYSTWAGYPSAFGSQSIDVGFDLESKPLTHGGGTVRDNLADHRWIAMVHHGRGLGQYRHITGVTGGTVHLDRPWDILPDETTFMNIVTVTEHNLWVNNMAGMGSGNSQFVYLAGVENIVAFHSMLLASGMTMYAMEMETDEQGEISDLGVVAYNQFVGCDARYSGMGLCLWTNQSWSWIRDKEIPHSNIMGNIMRWNSMIGGADSEYVKNQTMWQPVEIPSGIQLVGNYNLLEKNLLAGYDAGVHIRKSSYGNMLANNTMENVHDEVLNQGEETVVFKRN